mmetsp:Transcript_42487/g.68818  ORF Transcript_42487/g.68818 Transcript_42487/m.68818 type:complete len:118 (+) Transcript_42487:761-1114(+)
MCVCVCVCWRCRDLKTQRPLCLSVHVCERACVCVQVRNQPRATSLQRSQLHLTAPPLGATVPRSPPRAPPRCDGRWVELAQPGTLCKQGPPFENAGHLGEVQSKAGATGHTRMQCAP